MSNVSHIGPRSLGATVPLPESFLRAAEAFGLPAVDWTSGSKAFSFHRRRFDGQWGWEIWLHIDRLGLNLSCEPYEEALGTPFPRRRNEARAWAVEFAKRHGFAPMEQMRRREKPQPPRPSLRVVRNEGDGTHG